LNPPNPPWYATGPESHFNGGVCRFQAKLAESGSVYTTIERNNNE
jgi:hypothetical protein